VIGARQARHFFRPLGTLSHEAGLEARGPHDMREALIEKDERDRHAVAFIFFGFW
jgi:hypothetical protein